MTAQPSSDGDFTEVRYERRDVVAVITLDRPGALNAFTPTMHKEYRACLAAAEADPAVAAVVLTGEGRAFCSGADRDRLANVAKEGEYPVAAQNGRTGLPGYGVSQEFDRPFVYHFGLTKPIVAAINGPAVALGFVIAAYCDIRIASQDAYFATNFGPLGLPAEYGLSWLLPRQIGVSRATELLLTSRRFHAPEAKEAGFVTAVAPPESLLDDAVAYAADLGRRCAPSALRETKHQIYLDLLSGIGKAYDRSLDLVDDMVGSDDFREGVAALLEKRAPQFRLIGGEA